MKAVQRLTPSLPPKMTLDVLRQASKSCVVKRDFTKVRNSSHSSYNGRDLMSKSVKVNSLACSNILIMGGLFTIAGVINITYYM